jgi:Flp pilus assembly protein TadG
MMTPGRQAKCTGGTALIEFVAVVFLLVMTMLSSIEIERMFLVYTTLASAARAGARYAIVHGGGRSSGAGVDGSSGPANNPAEVVTVIKNSAAMGMLDITQLNINVTYPDGAITPGARVKVSVQYTYDPLISSYFNPLQRTLGTTTWGRITY